MIKRLVTAGENAEHINLDLLTLGEGESWEFSSELETVAIVLAGRIDVSHHGVGLGTAGGRRNVFEGCGYAVYAPPGSALRFAAVSGEAELALTAAPLGPTPAGPLRILGPENQRVALVGKATWSRSVRTILGPEHAASRLLLGETVNQPGNWSSYPPHKHDVQAPPAQVRLEEVYLFKTDPPGGFGVQIRYDDAHNEEAFLVHNNDFCVISNGYHPVVAAPGYSLYYLWVMAGAGREMTPYFDARHAWVQQDA